MALLADSGIIVTDDGFKKVTDSGRKVVSKEGPGIIKALKLDMGEFLDEFKKRSTSDKYADVATLANNYSNITLVHPELNRLPVWGKSDMKYFSRFKIARNPVDNGIIILVNMGNSKYSVIYAGGSVTSTIRELSTLCSHAEPLEGSKKGSLYEDLTEGMNDAILAVVGEYKKRILKTQEDFIRKLSTVVPCSMLRELSLHSTVQKKTKKDPNTGETREYLEPQDIIFYDGQTRTNTIEFIANHLDLFASRTELYTKMPRIYSNNPNEIALNHIDLDKVATPGECPTWEQFLKRFEKDEQQCFMAFVYGIFDAENTSRQSLAIVDTDGFSAKSVVTGVIADFMGLHLAAALQKDSLNNQFSLAKIWDKRLVIIDDNKNPKILWSEKMHMILGQGYADIEMKGKNSFSARLQCKVIINGNIPLEIHPDALHETSRVIVMNVKMTDEILKEFCELNPDGSLKRRENGKPIRIGDPTFRTRLLAEFPHFLYKCKPVYNELCPRRAEIKISDRMDAEIIANAPMETIIFAQIFDDNFVVDPKGFIPINEFNETFLADVNCNRAANKNVNLDEFRAYIKKLYPDVEFSAREYCVIDNGKRERQRGVKGIRRKDWDTKTIYVDENKEAML